MSLGLIRALAPYGIGLCMCIQSHGIINSSITSPLFPKSPSPLMGVYCVALSPTVPTPVLASKWRGPCAVLELVAEWLNSSTNDFFVQGWVGLVSEGG